MRDGAVAHRQQRGARQAAGLVGVREPFDGIAAECRVGSDHAIHGVPSQAGGNQRHLGFIKVGRNFDKHRDALAMLRGQGFAALGHGAEQPVERLITLERSQVLGVGARDIEGDVVGVGVDAIEAGQIVVGGALDRGGGVLADVQTQQHWQRLSRRLRILALAIQGRPLDVRNEGAQPLVVEAQAIDQRLRLRQAEHPRFGVAGLRQRSHCANLDKAEAHGTQPINAARVFVEPGGQADTVRKRQAREFNRIVDPARAKSELQRRALKTRQCAQGQFVRGFGVQAK